MHSWQTAQLTYQSSNRMTSSCDNMKTSVITVSDPLLLFSQSCFWVRQSCRASVCTEPVGYVELKSLVSFARHVAVRHVKFCHQNGLTRITNDGTFRTFSMYCESASAQFTKILILKTKCNNLIFTCRISNYILEKLFKLRWRQSNKWTQNTILVSNENFQSNQGSAKSLWVHFPT